MNSVVRVAGDGNCQFRALSRSTYGTEDYHMQLRHAAVNQIRNNPDMYQDFIPGGRPGLNKYLKDMSKPGFHGDEVSIKVRT